VSVLSVRLIRVNAVFSHVSLFIIVIYVLSSLMKKLLVTMLKEGDWLLIVQDRCYMMDANPSFKLYIINVELQSAFSLFIRGIWIKTE